MLSYLSMYKIKQKPEDFFVEEIPDLNLKDNGDYVYFAMEKKNWNREANTMSSMTTPPTLMSAS